MEKKGVRMGKEGEGMKSKESVEKNSTDGKFCPGKEGGRTKDE